MKCLRIISLSLPVVLALGLSALAEERGHDREPPWPEDWAPEFGMLQRREFRILPLSRASEIARKRFHGRLIAARIVPPRPDERERGVVLVHELRLLTPGRDVLRVRLDAHNGDFLEAAGAGMTDAGRKGQSR